MEDPFSHVTNIKPKFVNDIEKSDLFKIIIPENSFENIPFDKFQYVKEWDNQYVFKNIHIGDFITKEAFVSLLHNGIWVYLYISTQSIDSKIEYYFGWEGYSSYKADSSTEKVKLCWYKIFDKSAHISLEIRPDICVIKIWIKP